MQKILERRYFRQRLLFLRVVNLAVVAGRYPRVGMVGKLLRYALRHSLVDKKRYCRRAAVAGG